VVASAYQVRQPLTRAETGQVFEAWDMLVERVVALKVAWKDPGLAALLPEARRAAAVRDPVAVSVHAVANHRGSELVVAERVVGRTVTDLAGAYLAAGTAMSGGDVLEILVRAARGLAAAHAAQVPIGDISGETVLVASSGSQPGAASAIGRVVFGALSMSQVPDASAAQVVWAPEIVTRQRNLTDPGAQIGVDIYGLGCLAVELATCRPPFLADSVKATVFGHVHHRPPSIAELSPDLPVELGDLVIEMLDKHPGNRPMAAAAAVQLASIADRATATRRIVRVLIVDDDADRVRLLWSMLRRAHPRATVDAARDGSDAVSKLRRDRPDLVVVDTKLAGSMNALELCMYVSGLEDARGAIVAAIVDDVDSADTGVLTRMGAHHVVARDRELPGALGALVHQVAQAPKFAGATGRITISG
jgi:CheY-like chemotaxis protein